MMRLFARMVAASCLALVVIGAIVQFHPDGPSGVAARTAQIVVMLSSVLVALRWWFGPWPDHARAVGFVIWADCALAVVAVTMSTPESRLCATLYLGLVGVFAGFLLGGRILAVHCAFGAATIGGIVGRATLFDGADLFQLFIYIIPAVTWVVVVPLGGGLGLITAGRLAISRTARWALYDPLTGLRNRRGMYAAVEATLAGRTPPATVVMAVCDIDSFKQLNDGQGHAAGDAALIAMAQQLKAVARQDEITARIGGDELVLVAFGADERPVDDVLSRLASMTRVDVDVVAATASVGIASNSTADPHFDIDDLLRHADAAMYEAKRAGGARAVSYRPAGAVPEALGVN
ncbi:MULTISPECIES: GGDEF domain-containing protein [unclassified Mycobacterium]|uniref:GGDEF domain-containing protein n=1 Tax=unclassified Mycobacterium TaxID=2642494 RepID=UPI0029C988AC|nr:MULTISPECIES: GGDEF domain-containing protein [unclassified Mycobacterium]